jgi:hypothetical protein
MHCSAAGTTAGRSTAFSHVRRRARRGLKAPSPRDRDVNVATDQGGRSRARQAACRRGRDEGANMSEASHRVALVKWFGGTACLDGLD